MNPALTAGVLWLLLALPAGAAGPADGRGTASAEAGLRAEGAELVEIDGFAGPTGDIPCRGKSFSNAWHYKFFVPSSGEWLIVNACGDNFINAARHFPYMKSGEPTKKLPYAYAEPAAVLKKLQADGLFTPEPNPFSRDIQMKLRLLPAKDGRPEGCYWSVSQGKVKVLADCAAEKTWKLGKAAAGAPGGKAKPAVKGKDAAFRYADLAVATMRKKTPDAQLMLVETLADRTGSTKCVDPKDGWSFVFASRSAGTTSLFGGCKNKTAAEYMLFDGQYSFDFNKMAPITLPFKDSDHALAQVPKDCVNNTSSISMKLKGFKPAHAPAAGHGQVWVIDCGSLRYLVDAQTGVYLGPGKK